jgi:hypothetical protein
LVETVYRTINKSFLDDQDEFIKKRLSYIYWILRAISVLLMVLGVGYSIRRAINTVQGQGSDATDTSREIEETSLASDTKKSILMARLNEIKSHAPFLVEDGMDDDGKRDSIQETEDKEEYEYRTRMRAFSG